MRHRVGNVMPLPPSTLPGPTPVLTYAPQSQSRNITANAIWEVMISFFCQYTILSVHAETEMLSFWWNFHQWLHWKLSFWQLSVQTVMKISSKWWHFHFSSWPRCTMKKTLKLGITGPLYGEATSLQKFNNAEIAPVGFQPYVQTNCLPSDPRLTCLWNVSSMVPWVALVIHQ